MTHRYSLEMKVLKLIEFDDSYEGLWALSERIGSVKKCTGVSDLLFGTFETKYYPKKAVLNQEKQ